MAPSPTFLTLRKSKHRLTTIKTKTMKRYLQIIGIGMLSTVILLNASCKKDIIDRTSLYPALAPSNIDLNADSWKTVLVTDPTVFNVPAPDAVASPAYIADLNEIK